jgi:peptidoglycan hydrolase CwlO-like protein
MDEIVSSVVSALVALSTGFIGWFFGRKKQRAETTGVDIQNIGQALIIFQKDIVEPLRAELQSTREELALARQEIDSLRKDIEALHEENKQLKERYQK